MFRTRFKKEIVAEFLPPVRQGKKRKAIILCDGMPTVPAKQSLAEFLARRGYWVFHPRYRGAWESGGKFLEKSPVDDIADVITGIRKGRIRESAFGQEFHLKPDSIFVIGGSFGGAAAILASLDRRVTKVIAICPVVDWSILGEEQGKETSNKSYPAYIREAFGNGYRLTDRNWNKLLRGDFYNPAHHIRELTASKIMMFHAKDDPYIPWKQVDRFGRRAGIKLNLLARGGHLSTSRTVQKYWARIRRFFEA
jgi:pimeloyl-ACP methyl ester carboxylesterase